MSPHLLGQHRETEEGESIPRPSRVEEVVSSVDSDEVDNMVRTLMSTNRESTTIEVDEHGDTQEVIPEEDDEEALAASYIPPNEAGCAASIEVDADWLEICRDNRFCIKGSVYFAFLEAYELVLPVVGHRVTDCPIGHVTIYAHMSDFGLCFPLDPFIVNILQAWNIYLAKLGSLGWRNLIAYAWVVRYKGFPETLNLFRKLHWIKEDSYVKSRGVEKGRDPVLTNIKAGVDGCPYT